MLVTHRGAHALLLNSLEVGMQECTLNKLVHEPLLVVAAKGLQLVLLISYVQLWIGWVATNTMDNIVHIRRLSCTTSASG